MTYENIIKLRLPEIQLSAVSPMQLKFSIVKAQPTILLFETLFCMWECFSMGTELPTKVMLGQTLVLMQMTFLNNVKKVGRLDLSRTSCLKYNFSSLFIWLQSFDRGRIPQYSCTELSINRPIVCIVCLTSSNTEKCWF
jgi:hypothetical protein